MEKYDFSSKVNGRECHLLRSQSTSAQSYSKINKIKVNNCNKNKEELKCFFCGLQTENPKLLEIHMRSCRLRTVSQICKLCRSPIRFRSHGQQYCASCSIAEDKRRDLEPKLKAKTLTENLVSKSSRTVVPERQIKNGEFADVNARSSMFSKKRLAPTSDLKKQKEVKLKTKVDKRIMEKVNATEGNIEMQSRESHPTDKLGKSSEKSPMQQKKDLKVTNAEAPYEKFKNANLQKHNFKTFRRTDEKVRQSSKKNDSLLGKSNLTHKGVTLKVLHSSIPEIDCGMLLHSTSANKIDHFYKCCRCGKAFRNIKLGSMHYSNCKSTKFLNTLVNVNDIRWVCTICNSSFLDAQKLLNHLKGCNIFTKKYDRACEKQCKKCHFRCISSIRFQEHDCVKELDSMKSCTVRINTVKINSAAGRVIMRECEFCCEIFDEALTDDHFHSHHPGEHSSGNFKQYLVNLNPGPSSETVVVKTEPVSPVHEPFGNSPCVFEGTYHYSHVNSHPVPNPALDNISMPPPSVNLPVFQSSVSLSNHRSPSAQTGGPSTSRHSASQGAKVINKQFCKCFNYCVQDDNKPCLKCLSKLDITKFAKNFNVLPYSLAKVKKETSEDLGTLNSNTQAEGSAAVFSSQIVKEVDDESIRRQQFNSYLLDELHPSLTPPSSHDGISPPSTPTTIVQSLTHVEPCSVSDVSMGYLNDDISMVADISQLDEPNCVGELVHYINDDCSPVMSLMQCEDDQELFSFMESCIINHVWDVEDFQVVDAWAEVPSEGNTDIEKYICSECMDFNCLDQSSIIKHLYKSHEKKSEYLAMYLAPPKSDSL